MEHVQFCTKYRFILNSIFGNEKLLKKPKLPYLVVSRANPGSLGGKKN